jgi:hypothetical protein
MPIARPPLKLRRRVPLAGILAAAAVLAGCATHPPPPLSAAGIASAREFRQFTVYWAGPEINGVRLTQADSPLEFDSPVGFGMYYGDCESRGALRDGGCTLPLKITTSIYSRHSDASFGPQHWIELHGVPAVVYHGGDDIEIYVDRKDIDIAADSPAHAMAAAQALTLFNRIPTAGFPAFPQPIYTPNPPQAELNGQTGPTGPTGATGATSAIAPPAQLEPAPAP